MNQKKFQCIFFYYFFMFLKAIPENGECYSGNGQLIQYQTSEEADKCVYQKTGFLLHNIKTQNDQQNDNPNCQLENLCLSGCHQNQCLITSFSKKLVYQKKNSIKYLTIFVSILAILNILFIITFAMQNSILKSQNELIHLEKMESESKKQSEFDEDIEEKSQKSSFAYEDGAKNNSYQRDRLNRSKSFEINNSDF